MPACYILLMSARHVIGFVCGSCAIQVCVGLIILAGAGVPYSVARALSQCADTDTKDRTVCFESVIPALYPAYSVREILGFVRALQPIDPAFRDCHFIAHRLGEAVTAEDPSRWAEAFAAAGPEDQLCSYGYTHGVAIRAYDAGALSHWSAVDEARGACARIDPIVARDSAAHSPCFHSLGHILFFIAGRDMALAFTLCDELISYAGEGPSNRTRCHTGVAMQLIVPEDYLIDLDDPVYDPQMLHMARTETRAACDALSNPQHRGACMRGRWPLYAREILFADGVDAFCEDHPDEEQRFVCHEKLSITLGWYYVNDIDAIVRECAARNAPEHVRLCFRLAANEVMRQMGSSPEGVERAHVVCGRAPDETARRGCDEYLQSMHTQEMERYRLFDAIDD